jgi:hypothetical protein
MNIQKLVIIIGVLTTLASCFRKPNMENIILYANREAPLGHVHLTIFKDSTFEFELSGITTSKIWKGKAVIKKYSINFNYYDSIPVVGKKAYYNNKYVEYLEKFEKVEIKFNKLKSE